MAAAQRSLNARYELEVLVSTALSIQRRRLSAARFGSALIRNSWLSQQTSGGQVAKTAAAVRPLRVRYIISEFVSFTRCCTLGTVR